MSVAKRRWLRARKLRVGIGALVLVLALPVYVRCAPFAAPESKTPVPGTVVLAADGTVLERDGAKGFRIPVPLEAIAPIMREATIAAEDQRYTSHVGIDPVAMVRAALRYRSQPSGASTITQQLARRLYLRDGGGPLPVRKARESLIALQLDAHRSKDEVLELYLNDVYYGRGAYGVEAAARVYFGVSARNLDLASAAYLAGLPQMPSAYDPAADPAPGLKRQRYVLGRLAADGKIERAQAEAAAAQPLTLLDAQVPPIAHQFVQYALDELKRERPDLAGRDGLIIETTLDAGLQAESERLVRLRLDDLRRRNVTNGAAVAIEPGTGRVLAMVGSATDGSAEHGGEFNMALAPRQPGSALKPFLYASAFEHGFTAATPLLDVPTTFTTVQGPYTPLNFDRQFHGVVTLRTALASSFNVPAVRMLEVLGLDAFLEMAHRFGLATLGDAESYGLSLTLGGGDVRLLDLTSAYAALGAGGMLSEPYAVARVRDHQGRVVYEHAATPARPVLSAQVSYVLGDILSDAAAREPGFGAVTPFELPFKTAVKTGTTTGSRDNWTVGFTGAVAVGVWVGNSDGSAMQEVSGIDGAGPIWRDIMLAAGATRPQRWPAMPPGIEVASVCSPTGLLPGPDCPSPVREMFVKGTAPREMERYYTREADGQLAVDVPVEARAWAIDAGLHVSSARGQDRAVRIVSPGDGEVLFVSPELSAQQVVLRASSPAGTESVMFRVDGAVVGEVPGADGQLVWRLEPGQHRVEAVARGAGGITSSAISRYEVRMQ